ATFRAAAVVGILVAVEHRRTVLDRKHHRLIGPGRIGGDRLLFRSTTGIVDRRQRFGRRGFGRLRVLHPGLRDWNGSLTRPGSSLSALRLALLAAGRTGLFGCRRPFLRHGLHRRLFRVRRIWLATGFRFRRNGNGFLRGGGGRLIGRLSRRRRFF